MEAAIIQAAGGLVMEARLMVPHVKTENELYDSEEWAEFADAMSRAAEDQRALLRLGVRMPPGTVLEVLGPAGWAPNGAWGAMLGERAEPEPEPEADWEWPTVPEQIRRGVARGLSQEAIAQRMGISVGSVERHAREAGIEWGEEKAPP